MRLTNLIGFLGIIAITIIPLFPDHITLLRFICSICFGWIIGASNVYFHKWKSLHKEIYE